MAVAARLHELSIDRCIRAASHSKRPNSGLQVTLLAGFGHVRLRSWIARLWQGDPRVLDLLCENKARKCVRAGSMDWAACFLEFSITEATGNCELAVNPGHTSSGLHNNAPTFGETGKTDSDVTPPNCSDLFHRAATALVGWCIIARKCFPWQRAPSDRFAGARQDGKACGR